MPSLPKLIKGPYIELVPRLPFYSIDLFDTLASRFSTQFATSCPHHLTLVAQVNIQQDKKEPHRTFMERFSKVILNIRGVNSVVALHHLIIISE